MALNIGNAFATRFWERSPGGERGKETNLGVVVCLFFCCLFLFVGWLAGWFALAVTFPRTAKTLGEKPVTPHPAPPQSACFRLKVLNVLIAVFLKYLSPVSYILTGRMAGSGFEKRRKCGGKEGGVGFWIKGHFYAFPCFF